MKNNQLSRSIDLTKRQLPDYQTLTEGIIDELVSEIENLEEQIDHLENTVDQKQEEIDDLKEELRNRE